MTLGLSVADVVNVTIDLSPKAAQYRNFGALMVLGSSNVIGIGERYRVYTGSDGVANDFGVLSPEYFAAVLFFSQKPQPSILYIGRWAQTAVSGQLTGGVLQPAQQLVSAFTPITSGTLNIAIDGTNYTLTGINFSAVANLNNVASVLQTAIRAAPSANAGAAGATVVWTGANGRFIIQSGSTGATSTVGYATGTVATAMGLVSGVASTPVPGIAAEQPVAAAQILADKTGDWYGLTFADSGPIGSPTISNTQHYAVAQYIESSTLSRIYGVTITTTDVLDPTNGNDLASQLQDANFERTFTQYSSSSQYAVASMYGRAFTVNFEANNSTITLKFKQEPGMSAETLTETQAATLRSKNCNVFANYNNGTAIIQEGVMANGYFFDEVHGTDWLQNAIQNDVYNLLYQSKTKVPQTNAGNQLICTTIQKTLARAVNNGLLAPGQWNADGFGQILQGDFLPLGYYVYYPDINSQPQADRETRVSVPFQVAAKLAGAIHKANILVSVNR